jgi:hypothetical protein
MSTARRQTVARATLVLSILTLACSGSTPSEDSLRDSFAAQLAANTFLRDVKRDGNEVAFSGPGALGGTAAWRVVIETAVIEPYDDASRPYKGTVISSWYSDGARVQPSGRESNLPVELTSNGLAQECWALWNTASERWEWE